MSATVNVFSVAAISLGVFFFLAGTVGLLRFPDVYTRLHALAKVDNLGLGFLLLGLLCLLGGAALTKEYAFGLQDYRRATFALCSESEATARVEVDLGDARAGGALPGGLAGRARPEASNRDRRARSTA